MNQENTNNSVEIRIGMYDHSSGEEKLLSEKSLVIELRGNTEMFPSVCAQPYQQFKEGQWVIRRGNDNTYSTWKVIGPGTSPLHFQCVNAEGLKGNIPASKLLLLQGNEHLVLKQYDPMLVRDWDNEWTVRVFDSYSLGARDPFKATGDINWQQALPFKPFRHLIGTNKNPYETTENQ